MKWFPVVIGILMAMLVAAVTGCDKPHRYDARLLAADSLLRSAPDSALAIVEAICRDSLADKGDRAYRDLLLTQARYRCYVTATSDSDINNALAWFSDHDSECEKLTRAYIYKGAVMDELGHPDSAMLYYKRAEATAAPDDYFNQGYVKLRIGTLYQDQLSQDSAAIIRLKLAIKCFKVVKDTDYLISCYGQLAGICGLNAPDSTEYYLKQAITLAHLINSTKQYTYKSKLAGLYFYYYKDYLRAKETAMDVMMNGQSFSKERQFYYYAAMSYIRLGMLDSAICVFEATPTPTDGVDSMNNYQVMAEIDLAKNNLVAYNLNLKRSREEEIHIRLNNNDTELKVAEIDYDRNNAEQQISKAKRSNRHLTTSLCFAFIVLVLLAGLIIHMRVITNKKNKKIKEVEGLLLDNIRELEEKKQILDQRQSTVSELVGYRISALNELFESIRFKSKSDDNKRIRRIIPLSSVIIDLSEIYYVMKIELSDDFWDKLKQSIDAEYNGIATHVDENYPALSTKEKNYFGCYVPKFPRKSLSCVLAIQMLKAFLTASILSLRKRWDLILLLKVTLINT